MFSGLGLFDELMHTVASPPMAFLLFVIGLALLIFEFFTAGVGIAGGVGAVCVVLGCYGLAALPTRPVAVALLLLAMLAFAIDVQVGIPRLWTGVGIVLFIIGAWFLYEPVPGNDLRLGWITLIVGSRRRDADVHRRHAVDGSHPIRHADDRPRVDDRPRRERRRRRSIPRASRWSAAPGGGPAPTGRRRSPPARALKVVAIDGVTLEVEPEEGAARDYRERRAKQ